MELKHIYLIYVLLLTLSTVDCSLVVAWNIQSFFQEIVPNTLMWHLLFAGHRISGSLGPLFSNKPCSEGMTNIENNAFHLLPLAFQW